MDVDDDPFSDISGDDRLLEASESSFVLNNITAATVVSPSRDSSSTQAVEPFTSGPDLFENDFDGDIDLLGVDCFITSSTHQTITTDSVAVGAASPRSPHLALDTCGILDITQPLGSGAVTPFTEYFGAWNASGTRFSLAVELPYFALQDLIAGKELQQGAAANIPLSSLDNPEVFADFLRDSLGQVISSRDGDYGRQIARVMLEGRDGLMESRLRPQFFTQSSSNILPLSQLFGLVAFFVSNCLLEEKQIVAVLKWIVQQGCVPQFGDFLRVDTTTVRALNQYILPAVVSISNAELLKCLPLPKDPREFLLEAMGIENDDASEYLLRQVDPALLSGAFGGKLLCKLARATSGNINSAKFLLLNNADLNQKHTVFISSSSGGWFRSTPLELAVNRGHIHMVKLLLENGADPDGFFSYSERERHPQCLLSVACAKQAHCIVKLLVDHGATIVHTPMDDTIFNYASKQNTELYRLILGKYREYPFTVAEILAEAKKDSAAFKEFLRYNKTRLRQDRLEKALSKSAAGGDISTTSTLLGFGVDASGARLKQAPIQTVVDSLKEDPGIPGETVARLLINAGAAVNIPGLLASASLIGQEDGDAERGLEFLSLLIDAGADLNIYGVEALVTAASGYDAVEATAFLLNHEVPINEYGGYKDPDSETDYFLTPIQTAAFCGGSLELCQYLLRRGADINAPAYGHQGRTALQAACQCGRMEIVAFCLDNGADVNGKPSTSEGVTALEAIFAKHHRVPSAADVGELARYLLDHGADPTQPSDNNFSVIRKLIEFNLQDHLVAVLRTGVDPNKMNWQGISGRNLLQSAAEFNRLELAKLLVSHGANVNGPPALIYGRTALQAAAAPWVNEPGDLDMMRYLIGAGADVNAEAGVSRGLTAIQAAAISGCIPAAQLLFDHGADVNSQPSDKDGRTAIEGAAEHGRLDMVQWLLNRGAVGDVVRATGYKRAIELANKEGHYEIVKLLKAAQLSREIDELVAELAAAAH